ncbi:hydroxyacid dehydrogenase [Nonomuraea sp. NEAU-A123]|uniref:hydroxyacid dehydrogenase n=1 Tax=Nonomuraea sp. NEAU-A123 TaxID=2839649 RepID=UPI001BE4A0E4|nr:hydroxyacid dehydrogenase [Nonomuraea sp. NEAU-A123]MBT2234860.1 hydroxyacid dehydrogenase [Nonomuraea sp. NEAU-A123]
MTYHRPRALFALRPVHLPLLFPNTVQNRIAQYADLDPAFAVERLDDPRIAALLPELEILITGWGCPPLNDAFLDSAPRLRAVLHAAGTVKAHVTKAVWDRGILVSSAAEANAIPVAEYAVGAILLAGKGVFGARERYRGDRTFTPAEVMPDVGNYGRRIGIVGASRIGRQVISHLIRHDFTVHLYDPYAASASASVEVPRLELEELLATSDIVSLHAPATPETHHMLDRDRLALLPDGAVLINTAQGSLIDTDALIDELKTGRISAILDVTTPEPLPGQSVLFDLPNVFLTPHIAGSHGNELARMGASIADELERLVTGLPLRHRIHYQDLDTAA